MFYAICIARIQKIFICHRANFKFIFIYIRIYTIIIFFLIYNFLIFYYHCCETFSFFHFMHLIT